MMVSSIVHTIDRTENPAFADHAPRESSRRCASRVFFLFVFCATAAHAQVIRVAPEVASLDTPVRITVRGLQPGQPAIIRASTRDADAMEWHSWAGFEADGKGSVDVATRATAHGSYEGIDAMGLFWSMDVPGDHYGRRRFNHEGLETLSVRFDLEVDGRTVHSAAATRHIVSPEVKRADVRMGRLVGTLFTPAAARGAVLVLGGSEGGIGDETTAALLAGHGYRTLALAYFGAPPLPNSLSEVPLETFGAAIDYLKAIGQPALDRVAILGTSKGAEAALLVATMRSDISAVVAYAPSSVVWSCICDEVTSSWSLAGEAIPFVPPGRDPTYVPPRGFPIEPAVHYMRRLKGAHPSHEIRVDEIDAPLFLVAGTDDRLWPSGEMARRIASRRARTRARTGDEIVIIPNAGHLLSKTYLPAGSTRTGNGRLETGGTRSANARAASEVWPRVLRFLDRSAGAK